MLPKAPALPPGTRNDPGRVSGPPTRPAFAVARVSANDTHRNQDDRQRALSPAGAVVPTNTTCQLGWVKEETSSTVVYQEGLARAQRGWSGAPVDSAA
jgi:hypothetical protein